MQRSLRLWLGLSGVTLVAVGAALLAVHAARPQPKVPRGLYGPASQTQAQFDGVQPVRPKLETPLAPQSPSAVTPAPALPQGPAPPVKLLAYA